MFLYNLKVIFCSVKNDSVILIGIILNLYTAFGRMVIFTVLILPSHEHGRLSFFLKSVKDFITEVFRPRRYVPIFFLTVFLYVDFVSCHFANSSGSFLVEPLVSLIIISSAKMLCSELVVYSLYCVEACVLELFFSRLLLWDVEFY